jgi:aminoglycoside 6'-N-acetyltransferase
VTSLHPPHFTPLQPTHFPLLHKWMNTDHVAKWWGENRHWSLEDITQKYETYCKGYKTIGNLTEPIHAFIIKAASQPVGFIQYYNAYDFPREEGTFLPKLSGKLAALDFYIGEAGFIGKGFGPLILNTFLNDYVVSEFDACFVDPDCTNEQAIRAYEKTGFQRVDSPLDKHRLWMIKILN